MRRPRLAPCFALLAALTSLLTGCAVPGVPGATTGPAALPDAQQVFRSLDYGPKNGEPDSLDPARILFQSDAQFAQLIFPPLVTLDDQNRVIPWAAERWSVSPDSLVWSFHLRRGMRWSDGVPITAETYAYSINRSLDPCTGSGSSYPLSGMDTELIKGSVAFTNTPCPEGAKVSQGSLIGTSLIVDDARTLIIEISQPAGYLPAALASPAAWAQPRQLIERYGERWTEHLPDGSGFGGNLYTLAGWNHLPWRTASKLHTAPNLILWRNEGFWGAKPRLRELDWSLYDTPDALWADAQTGFGDTLPLDLQSANVLAQARKLPGFHQAPALGMHYLMPNWGLPPFDDLRVRQAFSLALDRRALAGTLPTEGIPTFHLVPERMPGYQPALRDPAGRSGEAALSPDQVTARSLWQSYVAEKCGGDAAQCPKVTYSYNVMSVVQAAQAKEYQHAWQAAMPGLTVTLFGVGRGCQRCTVDRYQLWPLGWLSDYPDPQDFLTVLLHTGARYNQTHISLLDGDTLLDHADAASDQAQRLQVFQRAEQLYITNVALIPVWQPLNSYLARPRVAGGYHERDSQITALPTWQRLYLARA